MMDKVLFGEEYKVIGIYKNKGKNIIELKSLKKCVKCPYCGQETREIHSVYVRNIQDTPLHNQETWLRVIVHEFKCTNKKCKVKTFNEELPFARKNKVMTDALVQLILSISIYLSSSSTSLILSFIGVKISSDTVDNIIKKIEIKDDENVEEIGIDDVAKRKGINYATAIYDLNDHHLIALLDGRDAEVLKDWLKKHKKIKRVARDRASSYATALNEILPECIQVADRFHLFENLIKHLKEIFYSEIPNKIFIKNGEIINPSSINKIPSDLVNIDDNILNSYQYNNSIPVDENGNEIVFDNKKHDLESKQYKKHELNRMKKYNKIKSIKERLKVSTCHDKKDIAEEYNISYAALLKYSKMTDIEVENILKIKNYKKRKTIMDNFINIIYKMLRDGISYNYIMAYIIKCGYKKSFRSLRDYINLIAKNNGFSYADNFSYITEIYPNDITVISRYDLLKYILTIDSKKKKNKIIDENYNIIVKKYPIVEKIRNIFLDFHFVVFCECEDLLDTFIEQYDDKIETFCKGLKKDIRATKNAISLKINSGFVEGNNNKFKLIKRIVYGKQKLCNLFKKSYLCFLSTLDNFAMNEIVEGVLNNN